MARGHHGADGGTARRDHAVVGRQHPRLREADLLHLHAAARRASSRACAVRSRGEVLVDLLGAR